MPTIDVSEGTNKRLLQYVESFDDTPDLVIQRLLDAADEQGTTPGAENKLKFAEDEEELLPEGDYWLPILEILVEAGGKARGRDVISALEARLGPCLTERDRGKLDMGEVRWRNRARFARLRMKERGLISNASPRGIWEITERGHAFLDAEQRGAASREQGP